jgi:hypothetical protein
MSVTWKPPLGTVPVTVSVESGSRTWGAESHDGTWVALTNPIFLGRLDR